jgi:hypothetical protein
MHPNIKINFVKDCQLLKQTKLHKLFLNSNFHQVQLKLRILLEGNRTLEDFNSKTNLHMWKTKEKVA